MRRCIALSLVLALTTPCAVLGNWPVRSGNDVAADARITLAVRTLPAASRELTEPGPVSEITLLLSRATELPRGATLEFDRQFAISGKNPFEGLWQYDSATGVFRRLAVKRSALFQLNDEDRAAFNALFPVSIELASPPPPPGVSMKQRYTLREFALGGIGFAGTTSAGEQLFIRHLAGGTAALEKLFAEGDPQAQAYALLGLRWLAPDRYAELKTEFLIPTRSVMTMSGCMGQRKSSAAVLGEIESGLFDGYRHSLREAAAALASAQ